MADSVVTTINGSVLISSPSPVLTINATSITSALTFSSVAAGANSYSIYLHTGGSSAPLSFYSNAFGRDVMQILPSGAVNFVNGPASTFGNGLITAGTPATAPANAIAFGGAIQTTVGAAGTASALPSIPSGYIQINVAGTPFVIPYYKAS